MSNAFDKASLVMLPHAYEEGKLYSLKPTDRSGDFTFSRGTDTATRVGPTGLIEKGRKNLLLQSNQFDSVSWSGLSKTSGILGYDGTNDAWEITKPAQPYTAISQSVSATGVWTFSLYAKANTLDKISIRNQTDGEKADIDLLNGLITYTSSGIVHSDIELISNDWYRLQITFSGSTAQIAIYVAWNNPTAGSVYIQDAMLNQGLVAYPYLETTTAPVYGGLTDDMPRLDYSGGATCPSLLLEPSRTNILPYSEYLGTGISTNECTQTITNETNPSGNDVSYLVGAIDDVNDQIRYDKSGLSLGSYFISVFVKGDGNANEIRMRGTGTGTTTGNVYWDVAADGTITLDTSASPSGVNAITESYGNGWYRIGLEETFDGTGRIGIYPSRGGVNISTYIWGLQWEAGSYPTSYIPTYGSSQTRAADVCGNAGDVNTFNSTEGVLYVEISALENGSIYKLLEINDGGTTNRVYIAYRNNLLYCSVIVGGASQFIFSTTVTVTDFNKVALKYAENDFALWVNGVEVANDTSGITSAAGTLNSIDFSNSSNGIPFYGKVNALQVYKEALTDTELQALTTL